MSYFDEYSKKEIKQIVRQSTSYKDFARKIGYSHSPSGDTIKYLQQKLKDYDTNHFCNKKTVVKRTVENTFIKNSTASQITVRKMYKKNQYTPYICSICGQKPVWQNKDLTLILDHINGVNNDNRLDNLRWVCPNCNQQLETQEAETHKEKLLLKNIIV